MGIKLFNTLSRKKEDFIPLNDDIVNFYSCGPTVYDYIHIGNARPLIIFDIFRRYLEFRGYKVNYMVNITDIDDKIINRANKEKVDFKDVSTRFSEAFFEDMESLGIKPATVHPRATENIDLMLELIGKLIDRGHAYEIDGDVYFDIDSFPDYGKLSGRNIDDMVAGARVDVDSRKKNPLDFALWKSSKPGEPSWDSPWGPGRPGWHIECSVMSMKYAGESLDIHAGGQDLIFPHHENETAQSEAATGKPFARYWLHNGFLDIEGEKMSKSLGNFLTVRDILKKYDAMSVRLFFLLKHYRSPIDFSEERMKEAQASLNRLKNAYRKIEIFQDKEPQEAKALNVRGLNPEIDTLRDNIIDAMDDDFNTAKAMGYLFELARLTNSVDEKSEEASTVFNSAKEVFDTFLQGIFGIDLKMVASDSGLTDDLMKFIIELRAFARAEKNWILSDKIRDGLKNIGVILEDRPDGTIWKTE